MQGEQAEDIKETKQHRQGFYASFIHRLGMLKVSL